MQISNIELSLLHKIGLTEQDFVDYIESLPKDSPAKQESESVGQLIGLLMNNSESTGQLMTLLMMKIANMEKQIKELKANA